ncbi:hypothetical protein [Agarivorans sp. QJM3NY_33]|uniref:hypothetical protein n=1 Tax=Agarivorans sp. QJM3NY_33 TaxID=3421432 RepID=UPI003D7E8342
MKPLSFPAQLDYYLSAVSCRDSLVNSLKDIIRPYKHGNILDCSVGTGFGIIDLIDSGYKITCSDACENMISRFNKNAQTTSVKTSPLKIKWQELGDKLPELFELILCRGNSIVYSDMWDKDNQSANVKEMKDSIKGIFKSIKSGGACILTYLQIKTLTMNTQ